jgi:hypothetical protein
MSATEILAQLPRLTSAERASVRSRLDEIEAFEPASAEEKQLIDARVAAYRQNPDAGTTWQVAEAEIRQQLGL